MKIYLIPGLGFDCTIFKELKLEGLDVDCIEWIEPISNESFHDYTVRLFEKLPDDDDIILVGHSFGAIVSQEIATVKKIKKLILISSIKSRKEIPLIFKLIKSLKLYRYFTKELCIKTVKYWGASHGFINEMDKELFRNMLVKQSNHYLQWALKTISEWNESLLNPETEIIQIHGTADKTFPIGLINKPDFVIQNGTHIMVYKKAEIINEILINEIK